MRLFLLFTITCILFAPCPSAAATAEAREVARINNCPPKKIEVYLQTAGGDGKTIYRVECDLPKAKEEKAIKTANAILVQCNASLCSLLRTTSDDNK